MKTLRWIGPKSMALAGLLALTGCSAGDKDTGSTRVDTGRSPVLPDQGQDALKTSASWADS
jgi:hypothetical protein